MSKQIGYLSENPWIFVNIPYIKTKFFQNSDGDTNWTPQIEAKQLEKFVNGKPPQNILPVYSVRISSFTWTQFQESIMKLHCSFYLPIIMYIGMYIFLVLSKAYLTSNVTKYLQKWHKLLQILVNWKIEYLSYSSWVLVSMS